MKNLNKFSQLIDDMTGRWSFEAKGYLMLAPLHVTFSVLLIQGMQNLTDVGLAILANFWSLAICSVFFFLLLVTVFRDRKTKNVPLLSVILSGALLGAVKGITTGYFVAWFGLEPDMNASITSRIVQTTVLGIWWVPTLAIIFAYRERFKLQRDALIFEKVNLASINQQQKAVGKSKRLIDGSAELRKFVAGVREQLASGFQIAGDNYKELAEVVRQIIQDDLRPLSHRIWEQENERLTDFSLRDLSNLTVTKYVFVPWPALPIYFFTVAPANVTHFGWAGGLLQTGLEITVIAIVFPLAKLVAPKTKFAAWLHFIGMTLICTVVALLTTVELLGVTPTPGSLITTIANFAWLLVLIFLTGLVQSALVSHEIVQRELVELVGAERAVEQLEFQRKRLMNRELAQYLHGHVQNRLMATAIRLDQADSLSDPAIILQELERVEELLENALSGFNKSSITSVAEEVRAIESQWNGLIDLKLKIEDKVESLSAEASLVNDIGQAVNELISNSIRHGFSSKITISIFTPTPNKLIITSFDDGLGPRSGTPGLGSFLFDSLCGNNWSLSAAIGGGTISRLEIGLT